MLLPFALDLLLAVCLGMQAPAASPAADCQNWQECRQQALDAASRHDYERFHDLAWRTVQKGPPRDPELMLLLARAQSLSGRPHDALVMIARLAESGFRTTATTSPEFERMRNLPEWSDVRSRVALTWVRVDRLPELAVGKRLRASGSRLESRAPSAPVTASAPAGLVVPPPPSVEEVLRLPPMSLTPAGLAHDDVSGRYVLADRARRKLVIVDERAHHVVDLVDAASAGFNDIAALVIDARRGDLWVVSGSEAESDKPAASILHRVQLISGRPLAAWSLPASFGPARFADVDVGDGDTVFVLDAIGKRIFPVTPRSGRFGTPLKVPFEGLTSLAVVGSHDAYVSHRGGITRVSLAGGGTVPVRAAAGVELKGFERIRWDRGRLLGIRQLPDGSHQPMRLRLSASGTRVIGTDVIETPTPIDDPTAVTVSDDSFYFVTRESPNGVIVLHRARLQ
jgi:hypothetical protein